MRNWTPPGRAFSEASGTRTWALNVANWLEADRVSNAELREVVSKSGVLSISIGDLPPQNGPRRVGESDPRFFSPSGTTRAGWLSWTCEAASSASIWSVAFGLRIDAHVMTGRCA